MAYDSQRGRTVLFGGYNGFAHLADTWEWDGTLWQPMLFAVGPTARQQHAMAYDAQRNRTVLFGGNQLTDTWDWDGTTWTQLPATGPSSSADSALVYDNQRGRIILHGTSGDTWELWNGQYQSTAVMFGNGCGTPSLDLAPMANGRPTINSTARALLTNTPSLLSFVVLGWSQTTFGPFQLPLPLAGFGMPGCDLLQSSESGSLPTTSTGPGTAIYNLPLPNWSGLIGVRVYLQAWAYAPGANAGNTIVSNGIEWAIGNS